MATCIYVEKVGSSLRWYGKDFGIDIDLVGEGNHFFFTCSTRFLYSIYYHSKIYKVVRLISFVSMTCLQILLKRHLIYWIIVIKLPLCPFWYKMKVSKFD
jgi:hypothetical protein